ncbi:MAG: TlpA disulfide reductase family protein [Burkholderiaceae bacterium]
MQHAHASYKIERWPSADANIALSIADLDGKPWNLPALRGKVVILAFWATWCEPCREEMPSLAKLQARLGADQIAVLAVNYQEGEPKIRQFMEAIRITLPVARDSDGAVAKQFGVRVFPNTIVIDRSGKPRWRITGEFDWNSDGAVRLVQPLLTKKDRRAAAHEINSALALGAP